MIFHWVKEVQKHAKSASFDHFYSKGRKLGSGKFSTVYQCQHHETKEIAAVKVINKQVLSLSELEFLREELQIIRVIAHPHIVQMRETYQSDSHVYIIMEQVDGGELYEYIHNNIIGEREVAAIMFQLL